ncbi:hypothetical protein PAMP_013844 [Pampus punctatissimus]
MVACPWKPIVGQTLTANPGNIQSVFQREAGGGPVLQQLGSKQKRKRTSFLYDVD